MNEKFPPQKKKNYSLYINSIFEPLNFAIKLIQLFCVFLQALSPQKH